jgi:hypothetical protein
MSIIKESIEVNLNCQSPMGQTGKFKGKQEPKSFSSYTKLHDQHTPVF